MSYALLFNLRHYRSFHLERAWWGEGLCARGCWSNLRGVVEGIALEHRGVLTHAVLVLESIGGSGGRGVIVS